MDNKTQGFLSVCLLAIVLLLGAQTYVAFRGPELPKLPKRPVVATLPTVTPTEEPLEVFVKTDDGENSQVVDKDKNGLAEASFPASQGQTVNVSLQDNELHVEIVSPGAHPPNDE